MDGAASLAAFYVKYEDGESWNCAGVAWRARKRGTRSAGQPTVTRTL